MPPCVRISLSPGFCWEVVQQLTAVRIGKELAAAWRRVLLEKIINAEVRTRSGSSMWLIWKFNVIEVAQSRPWTPLGSLSSCLWFSLYSVHASFPSFPLLHPWSTRHLRYYCRMSQPQFMTLRRPGVGVTTAPSNDLDNFEQGFLLLGPLAWSHYKSRN